MNLIVVRHAETIGNIKRTLQSHCPGELSEQGKNQAEKLAQRLFKENIDFVYSSDLKRCKDTLAPLLKLKNLPVIYTPELRERNFGIFSDKDIGEFYSWLEQRNSRYKFNIDIPQGENFRDVLKRTKNFLEKIIEKHQEETVLIMTHGATKVAIMLNLFNEKAETHYQKYKAVNTALSLVNIDEHGKKEAKVINSLYHLDYKL